MVPRAAAGLKFHNYYHANHEYINGNYIDFFIIILQVKLYIWREILAMFAKQNFPPNMSQNICAELTQPTKNSIEEKNSCWPQSKHFCSIFYHEFPVSW